MLQKQFRSDVEANIAFWSGGCKVEHSTGAEATMTPGIYYHGSAASNITEFRSQAELANGPVLRSGIFFTQNPAYAAAYIGRRSKGLGGRVYRVELVTSNAFVPAPGAWDTAVRGRQGIPASFEEALCKEVAARGHDSIISSSQGCMVAEAIIFDRSAIRLLETSTANVPEFKEEGAFTSQVFYQVDGLSGPDYAPECERVFINHSRASEAAEGRPTRAVWVNALNPTYCHPLAWPNMQFDCLRHFSNQCLIDPSTGDALVVEPRIMMPLSRALVRGLRRKQRRSAAWVARGKA